MESSISIQMKMNEIPKISITQDFSNNDPEDLDTNECVAECIQDAHTDIENLDSDMEGSAPKNQLLLIARQKVKSKKIDNCATDIEDCEDSGSDDVSDLCKTYDARLSLNEFLDQGFVDETSSFGGNDKIKHSRRIKNASLLIPQEDDGAVTDCEDLYGSDNENETISKEMIASNQKFNDFLLDNDDFSSVDVSNSALVRLMKSNNRSYNASDNECGLPINNWNELSDVENIVFSDHEGATSNNPQKRYKNTFEAEEMTLALSDVEDTCGAIPRIKSQPEIAVSFANRRSKRSRNTLHAQSMKANRSGSSLAVQKNADDGATDVENLESSDDEKVNMRKTLSIPMALVNAAMAQTDVEDFDADDMDVPEAEDIKLPSPSREIIVSREDKHGDPVSKCMPLVANSSGFLGIAESYVDKGLTDTEDISGNEEEYNNTDQYVVNEMPNMDNDVVSSSEGLTKIARNDIVTDMEPVTDVEDIKMVGSKLRRRKSKPKSNRPKGILLSVQRQQDAEAVTDNEEILLSDEQAAQYYYASQHQAGAVALQSTGQEDGATDVEEISDDEEFHKKSKDIDPNVFRQETFFSTITLSDASNNKSSMSNQGYSKISTTIRTREAHDSSADLGTTDIEEMIHSDAEENLCVDGTPQRNSTPNVLRCAFNESLSSHVHDQSKSEFDNSDEAQHIKGYGNIEDAHTDVECLDDEKSKADFSREKIQYRPL